MTVPKREDIAWESKWLDRARTPEPGIPQSNGLIVPESVLVREGLFADPRYVELIEVLPESKRSLLDELLESLIYPEKFQE